MEPEMIMAQLTLALAVRKRWFFTPIVMIAALLIALRLIRDVPSPDYVDGVKPAADRVAPWLARVGLCTVVAEA